MAGTRIALRREGVTFAAPEATLRLFAGGIDLTKSMLVLAPHPDDAEIAAFGLYANRNASVVTVTAGNAGAPTYEAVFDDPGELYLFKGRIRLIDSITVPWQGGIPPERTFNMGYFDARLAEMHDKREAVIPEMYRPNTDINVYRRENIGSLLPMRPRESKWSHLVDDMLALAEEGEAGGHRRAASAARHASRPPVHHGGVVGSARAVEQAGDASALHESRRPESLSVRPGGHADVASASAAAATCVSIACIRHPVSPGLQRLKLFALESMHDLRYSPTRQYQLARPEARAVAPEKPVPSRTSRICAAARARTSCSSCTTGTASVRW